jgi:nucleotide-binding universal stress UspA family protein
MTPKILVPVDFTKTAFSAYMYANQFAHACKGEITLIHVLQGNFSTADTHFVDTLESLVHSAKQRLEYFANEYPKELGYSLLPVKTGYEIRYGVPGFTVTDFASDMDYQYIVAGTKDNHNIIEKILGTTSKIMAKTTRVPIIFIHENTRYVVPQKIVFAIDDKADFDECIDVFMNFNQNFLAKTVFIHIGADTPALEQTKSVLIKEIFESKYPTFSFDVKSVRGSDVTQSIIDFSIFEKVDVLAVVHRKKGFFSDLFESSVSLKAVEGIHLPILWLVEHKVKHAKNEA